MHLKIAWFDELKVLQEEFVIIYDIHRFGQETVILSIIHETIPDRECPYWW